jgi:hypothetical protein
MKNSKCKAVEAEKGDATTELVAIAVALARLDGLPSSRVEMLFPRAHELLIRGGQFLKLGTASLLEHARTVDDLRLLGLEKDSLDPKVGWSQLLRRLDSQRPMRKGRSSQPITEADVLRYFAQVGNREKGEHLRHVIDRGELTEVAMEKIAIEFREWRRGRTSKATRARNT